MDGVQSQLAELTLEILRARLFTKRWRGNLADGDMLLRRRRRAHIEPVESAMRERMVEQFGGGC